MAQDDEGGLSTPKKVVAGAALGVAIPAAIGVARRLTGGDGDQPDEKPASEEKPQASRPRSTARAAKSSASGAAKRATRTTTRAAKSTAKGAAKGAGRTKEQLYREAKRLKVEGRSRMTKSQLERAVTRARG